MQTACLIGEQIHMLPTPLDGLMEHDFGVLEGTVSTWKPSRTTMIKGSIFGWAISPWKEGESLRQMQRRVKQTYREILRLHPGCSVLIVTHHGVINVILQLITRRYFTFFQIAPAMVIELEVAPNGAGKTLTNVPTIG